MEFACSRKSLWMRSLSSALWVGGLLTVLITGCEEGIPPTKLIDPGNGDPSDFLPPEGVVIGSVTRLDLLYHYDRQIFVKIEPLEGTDDQFIKRGRVLVLLTATVSERLNPPASHPTLAAVYANPSLFGFEADTAENVGFKEGEVVPNASSFWPLDNSGGISHWDYNHNNFKWIRRDTLMAKEASSTDPTGEAWRLRWMCTVNTGDPDTFLPNAFNHDMLVRSDAAGIFLHGFTLTAERTEVLPAEIFRAPDRQRNPRFLWLSQNSLGQTNSNQNFDTSIGQCLDEMNGVIDLAPVQLAAANFQVGQTITTWTYVSVDTAEMRRRIAAEESRQGIRCSGSGVSDIKLFPSNFFRLLARYEVAVERADDFVELLRGLGAINVFGTPDGVVDVVKLVITMYVGSPRDVPVQRIELFLMRGVGPVIQVTGIFSRNRTTTRLRQAEVNGVVFTEADFGYRP